MAWRKWRLGAVVSVALSLLVAGAGLTGGMGWKAFVAVFCGACLTHFGTFLTEHPVDSIEFSSGESAKPNQTQNKDT